MRALFILLGHLLTTIARLLRPGGTRAIVAESALLKQQLLVVNRSRKRAPNLSALDRVLFGSWSLLLGESRISRFAVILWVMAVMDQFIRRIIGFAVHAGDVNGIALCRMFNKAISRTGVPRCLSTDNDSPFEYHRWDVNLSALGAEEIKSVAYVPLSHPFVERLIGTTGREFLDHTSFYNPRDLNRKLNEFTEYYNGHRAHTALGGAHLRKPAARPS